MNNNEKFKRLIGLHVKSLKIPKETYCVIKQLKTNLNKIVIFLCYTGLSEYEGDLMSYLFKEFFFSVWGHNSLQETKYLK